MDDSHYRRGQVLFDLGRYHEAEREFCRSLTGDASDADAQRARAFCFFNLWKLAEGETAAKEALSLEPDHAANHYALALCSVERLAGPDWLPRAESAVAETLRLAPRDSDVWSLLARLRSLEQRWVEAVAAAIEGLRHDPRHLQCQILRGHALLMMKATVEAEIAAREALEIAPESSAAHSLLGQVLLSKCDHASSERVFLEALRLEPDRVSAHRGLKRSRFGWLQWISPDDQDAGLIYDPHRDRSKPTHGPNCAFLADQFRRDRQGNLDWLFEKGLRFWVWLPPALRAKGRNDIVSFTRMLTFVLWLALSALVMAALLVTAPSVPTPASAKKKSFILGLAAVWLVGSIAAFWLGGHCKNYLERKLMRARWQFSTAQVK